MKHHPESGNMYLMACTLGPVMYEVVVSYSAVDKKSVSHGPISSTNPSASAIGSIVSRGHKRTTVLLYVEAQKYQKIIVAVPVTPNKVIIFDGPDVWSETLKPVHSLFHASLFHCTILIFSNLSSSEKYEQLNYHFTPQQNVSELVVHERGTQIHFFCKSQCIKMLKARTNISLFLNVTILSLTLHDKTSVECNFAGISAYDDEEFAEIATQCQSSDLIAPNRRMYSKGRIIWLVLYSSPQTQFDIVFVISATKCQINKVNVVEFCNPSCSKLKINHTIHHTNTSAKNATLLLDKNRCIVLQLVFVGSENEDLVWLTNSKSDIVVQLEPNFLPGEMISIRVLGFMRGTFPYNRSKVHLQFPYWCLLNCV